MSSSDHAKTQHTAAGLEDALQRIAGQVGDADRRHRDVLADMQARLGQFGRQVEEVGPAVPEQYAGALGRLEHEIASLTERVAAYGQERQARKDTCNTAPSANNPWDEPWDARSAEALTRIYETTQADSPASRQPRPASGRQPWPMQAATAQPHAPAPAYDRAWLEGRFANIAAQLQQSLRDNNPAKPLAALDRRLGRLEDRLDSLFKDMSVHFSGAWLELIEEHIKGLAGHFEATRRQLARLDAVDEQLRQLVRVHEEQLPWSRAQPSSLGDDAIADLIDTAAERAASRLAATVPAPVMPALEAEGSKRIDALERLLQDYIAERRRGEEATSGMLRHIEAALMRLLDRVDAMEAAGAAAGGPGSGDAPGPNGMDAESKRLAEAYAAGARILGQKPSAPPLDAADYASSIGHREVSPQSTAGRPGDAVGADDAQTRQDMRVSALRAELKALAVPEEPMAVGPAADATKADTDKRQHARTWLRPRRSWSNLLLGGAVLPLFGLGYLAVDLLTAPGVAPALQQKSPAHTVEDLPATGPVRLKAERGGATEPQPAPQTGKSEIAPPTPDDAVESLAPPAPQPPRRPAREIQNDDVGSAHPPQQPTTVPTRALPGMALQDMPRGPTDGAAPVGIDSLASLGVGTAALRTAAVNGDALAQLEVAARFAEGDGVARDHKLAFAWYERAAMRGLATAQFRLAAYYERGVGVAIDTERARIWYRRAAEQGHVRSMHNLAVLIVGSGKDDADYAAAAHWFQQAADRGLSDSQFNLAVLYAHGRGVAKDLTESYKWFGLAARSGDTGAARKLEEVRAQLETLELQAAEQKIAAWRAKPAGR